MANRMPRVAQLRAVSGGDDSRKSVPGRKEYLGLALAVLVRADSIPNADALASYYYARAQEFEK